jgi:hypothetical protein
MMKMVDVSVSVEASEEQASQGNEKGSNTRGAKREYSGSLGAVLDKLANLNVNVVREDSNLSEVVRSASNSRKNSFKAVGTGTAWYALGFKNLDFPQKAK